MAPALTRAELDRLPPVIDLATAGRALGIGRTKAYELARTGEFPCNVLRLGNSYRVPTAFLRDLLGLTTSEKATAQDASSQTQKEAD
ncbi:DNA-binding protein [Actinomadura sp. DC4]|uniref:DNA-binding protein n=1 Tax=Actinomadura sp. DC4 TaxID=3055069 RepID=UPI0025AFAF4B|nr:DNA-binding protein [Actinomadura sp. DC4]MDN3356850.1 DNA-binding protein [Actinomadura sp. DC4]